MSDILPLWDLRSNRTIVGLKPVVVINRRHPFPWQQSHHCGIETQPPRTKRKTNPPQQSHHCGIETEITDAVFIIASSSNRTIVGLKQAL